MAEAGPSGAGNEEADRSFDGFEEEDDKDEAMEIGGDGSRRRIFSKVSNCISSQHCSMFLSNNK